MPATATGRGAQVILDGDAQAAARGVYRPTLPENSAALATWQQAGLVADGSTADGSTLTGQPANDLQALSPAESLNAEYAQPIWPAQGSETFLDFAGPAGTDLTALGWTKAGGAASTAKVNGSGSVDFVFSAAKANYTIETGDRVHYAEAYLGTPAATASSFPLCVRMIDANNFVGLRISTGNAELYQRVGGTFTSLFTVGCTAVAGVQSRGNYRVEARANDTVALYFAGNLIAVRTIPAALTAATKVGMCIRATLAAALDDFRVYTGSFNSGRACGSWCWFAEPRAVSASGKTWFGYTKLAGAAINAGAGSVMVGEFNHATGVATEYTLIATTNYNDDHCNAMILIRPDGRLVAFYSLHPDPNGLHFRISVNPYDASAWGAEAVFAAPGVTVNNYVTYPSPVMLSAQANRVYVFFRGIDQGLCAITSDNLATASAPASDGAAHGTVTWAAAVLWMDVLTPGTDKGVYHKVWSDGVSRIDFAVTNATAGGSGRKVDVRHWYYDGTTARASNGAPLPAFPLTIANATPIATTDTPDNMGDVWVWDCYRNALTGFIYVVFVRFYAISNQRCWYAVWDGRTWRKAEIPGTASGPIINPDGGSIEWYYSPGVCLDAYADGVVYAGVGPGYTNTRMYRLVTADGGATWARQDISPATRQGASVLYSGSNFRPVVPRGRDARACAVLWLSGNYDDTSNMNPVIGGGFHSNIFSMPLQV